MKLDRDLRLFAVAYALLLPAYLAPLFATSILPGLDLPFHAALADMIAKAGAASSPYAGYYEPRFWPPPPALPWLVLAAAGKIAGVARALHVVIALYVALLPLAIAAFARALGGSATIAVFAFPLAYNLGLHYGFLGYALSLPVFFVALACAAIALEGRNRRSMARRSVALGAIACLLYGFHVETYGIAMLVIIAMAAFWPASRAARAFALVALAPSMAIAATWHFGTPYVTGPAHRGIGAMLTALLAVRRAEQADRSLASELVSRFEGLPVHLLRGFRDRADITASKVLLGLLAIALVIAIAPIARRVDARRAIVRLAAPALTLLAYVALPHHFDEYEAMTISPRLAPLFVLAVVAAVPLARASAGESGALALARRALFGVAAIGGFVYALVLRHEYEAYDREVADFREVAVAIPPGQRVVGLVFDGESRVMNVESILRALPSTYVTLAPAPGSMVPLRYCGMRHIPCSLGPRARDLPPLNPWTPHAFLPTAPGNPFDHAIAEHWAGPGSPLDPARTEIIGSRGAWSALRWRSP